MHFAKVAENGRQMVLCAKPKSATEEGVFLINFEARASSLAADGVLAY